MKRAMLPVVLLVEPLYAKPDSLVRVFFSTGKIVDVRLPTKRARWAHIVEHGIGIDVGDGGEMSASCLHDLPGKVWKSAPRVRRAKVR
jgi:hypothetical protein